MKRYIYASTYNGFDQNEFDEKQLEAINEGIEEGLDISKYADPKFTVWQMIAIQRGLRKGLDVGWFSTT